MPGNAQDVTELMHPLLLCVRVSPKKKRMIAWLVGSPFLFIMQDVLYAMDIMVECNAISLGCLNV